MKFCGKRIPKGSLLLLLSFLTISLCLMMMLSALRADKINNQNRNGLYSGHQKRFTVISAEDEHAWEYVIPVLKEEYSNFSIYSTISDDRYIVRGMYKKGAANRPSMIWGRYFDEDTSWTDNPAIVLGRNFEPEISERDGKKYYDYQGITFEVIGIMGTEKENRINNMIIMDFKSSLSVCGINSDYMIDAKRAGDVEKIGAAIYETFRLPARVIITFAGNGKPWLAKILSGDMIMDTMYVMMFLSFSLSTVLVTFIWLEMRASLFYSWKLCGYKRSWELAGIAKRYYTVAGIGYLSGVLMMMAISNIINDLEMAVGDILFAFLITAGLGTIILLFCYGKHSRA
ncbi:MAG: hypothetical protein HFH14_06075 [Lachnospiraceae bacterium]|nr:hypothetical protein [Lachnospiraceae bacterium]